MPKYEIVDKLKQNKQYKDQLIKLQKDAILAKKSYSFQDTNQNSSDRNKSNNANRQKDRQLVKQDVNLNKMTQADRQNQVEAFTRQYINLSCLLKQVTKDICHPSVILVNSKDKINTQTLFNQHKNHKQQKSIFLCQKISNYLTILREVQQSFKIFKEHKCKFINQYQIVQKYDNFKMQFSIKKQSSIHEHIQHNNKNKIEEQKIERQKASAKFLLQNQENLRRDKQKYKLSQLIKNTDKLTIDNQGAFKNINIFPFLDKRQVKTPSSSSQYCISQQRSKRKTKLSQYSSITQEKSYTKKLQHQGSSSFDLNSIESKKYNSQLLSEQTSFKQRQNSRIRQLQKKNKGKQIDIDLRDNFIWKTVNQTNKFQQMLKMMEAGSNYELDKTQ